MRGVTGLDPQPPAASIRFDPQIEAYGRARLGSKNGYCNPLSINCHLQALQHAHLGMPWPGGALSIGNIGIVIAVDSFKQHSVVSCPASTIPSFLNTQSSEVSLSVKNRMKVCAPPLGPASNIRFA